jgi:hypothetical protein
MSKLKIDAQNRDQGVLYVRLPTEQLQFLEKMRKEKAFTTTTALMRHIIERVKESETKRTKSPKVIVRKKGTNVSI